jgi:HEPN domain-containing protein
MPPSRFNKRPRKPCKGWLIAHGWRLVRTHDLVFLIGEIRQHGQEIGWFDKSAAMLSKEFFEERYVSWDAEQRRPLSS